MEAHELENKLTRVQTDVSYLKKKMDKVEIKLEEMDDKTDQLMVELPKTLESIMKNYVTVARFEDFQKTICKSVEEHKSFNDRISIIETKFKIGAAVFSIAVFILTFGEIIVSYLKKLLG